MYIHCARKHISCIYIHVYFILLLDYLSGLGGWEFFHFNFHCLLASVLCTCTSVYMYPSEIGHNSLISQPILKPLTPVDSSLAPSLVIYFIKSESPPVKK